MLGAEACLRDPGLEDRLVRLGFRDHDRADALRAANRLLADGKAAAVQRMAEAVRSRVGAFLTLDVSAADPWDDDAARDDAYGQGVLPLFALVVAADEVVAFHQARGLSREVSWRSLADLGQQVWVHRLTFGEFGLHTYGWLLTAWSGALLWLGRLQFNLQPGPDADWVLSTHIPQSGPLTPAEVDDAAARARTTFPRVFPEHPTTTLHCQSWLLDPQLAQVLPPTSNLVRFQRRWQLFGEPQIGDDDVIFFVFRRRGEVDLAGLPQTTTLERAAVRWLRSGGHWYVWQGLDHQHEEHR